MAERRQLTAEDVRMMATSNHEKQHLDKNFETSETRLVAPPGRKNGAGNLQTTAAEKPNCNAASKWLTTGLTGLDSVNTSEAVGVVCKYTKAQEKEEKA